MATGKRTLPPFTIVNGTSLASSFQSTPVSVERFDRVFIEILCSGSPTGTVTVQGSNDYNPASLATPNWFDLPLSLNDLTGSAQNYVIDMQQTAAPWLRISYTSTSGSGNMTAVITAKES